MSTEIKIFVGIDVSKDTLDMSLNGNHEKIKNTKDVIEGYIKGRIGKKTVELCTLESTGGYERLAMVAFNKAGIRVHRAHPNKVHHFAMLEGRAAKTDKSDSGLLERYGRYMHDKKPVCEVMSEEQLELKNLRSVQSDLDMLLQANKCRAKMLSGKSLALIEEHIEFIEKKLEQVLAEMNEIIAQNAEMRRKKEILISHVGVGQKTANSLISELPELGKIGNKEIASLVGVAPRTFESGKTVGKSRIGGGRATVRRALYMAALSAIRYDEKMKKYYQMLRAKGKAAKVALVAIIRKMILCLNSMVKNDRVYEKIMNF